MDSVLDRFHVGEAVEQDDWLLLPIEHLQISASRSDSGYRLTASKEPYAVIVRNAGHLLALATDASTLSIESLKLKVENLDQILASYQN